MYVGCKKMVDLYLYCHVACWFAQISCSTAFYLIGPQSAFILLLIHDSPTRTLTQCDVS